MEAITGDETGLIKLLDLSKNQYYTYGEQSRSLAVESLSWVDLDGGDADVLVRAFAAMRCNGSLEAWKYEPGALTKMCAKTDPDLDGHHSKTVQLQRADDSSTVLSVSTTGRVALNKLRTTATSSPSSSSSSSSSTLWSWQQTATFQVRGPVSACATCLGAAAVGGRENDVMLYDLRTHQPVWEAKNVPYDSLRMRVPVWVTALAFVQPAVHTAADALLVTGTGHKHVRLYDVKAGQQPVLSLDTHPEHRITTVQPLLYRGKSGGAGTAAAAAGGNGKQVSAVADPLQVVVGYCSGLTELWDLRTQRRVKTLRGAAGSIRCSAVSSSGAAVANVGLDRFLRIYDVKASRSASSPAGFDRPAKVVHSCYLKNRLNCCLVHDGRPEATGAGRSKRNQGDDDDDDDGDEDDDDDDDEGDEDDEDELEDFEGFNSDEDGGEGKDEDAEEEEEDRHDQRRKRAKKTR